MRRQQLMTELYRRTGPAKVPEAAAHIAALLEAGGSKLPAMLPLLVGGCAAWPPPIAGALRCPKALGALHSLPSADSPFARLACLACPCSPAGEKVLVFAHHQEVLNELQLLALEPSGRIFVRIDGQVSGCMGRACQGITKKTGRPFALFRCRVAPHSVTARSSLSSLLACPLPLAGRSPMSGARRLWTASSASQTAAPRFSASPPLGCAPAPAAAGLWPSLRPCCLAGVSQPPYSIHS